MLNNSIKVKGLFRTSDGKLLWLIDNSGVAIQDIEFKKIKNLRKGESIKC